MTTDVANDDYVTSIRLPRKLADRVRTFARQRSAAAGVSVTFADALRLLIDRGLADATRIRKAAP